MSKKTKKSLSSRTIKKSTDVIIADAIARQNDWMSNRSRFASKLLKKINVFARKESAKTVKKESNVPEKKSSILSYWFPILCAVFVIFVAAWVIFIRTTGTSAVVVMSGVPEPTINIVDEKITPKFDIVRIEKSGNIIVAGRFLPNKNISIIINKNVVATELTNSRGEFVYAPKRALNPGNYTLYLVNPETDLKSLENVFLYISPLGYENSLSLLMTKNGSTLLQSPKLVAGDLVVSKIDYLETGRIVITGNALPRLRVSMTLNDNYLGFARVSDHKHFGLGADTEKLKPGKEYKLSIRLHDGDGKIVSQITHKFIMPDTTGNDDTFYTVRRGDCLWIIAKNFMRRGVLFSIIADANRVKNPNLIYPKQVLQIPIKEK